MRTSILCGAGRPNPLSRGMEPSTPSEPSEPSTIGEIPGKSDRPTRDGPPSVNRPNRQEAATSWRRRSHYSEETSMSTHSSKVEGAD